MPKFKDIPFSCLPHQSALFLKYLELSPSALRFYHSAPTLECLEKEARRQELEFPRSEIISILRRQNTGFGCGPETMKRIEELGNPGCVAILTGQQAGLFAGPLYTIYKALTAIKIGDELRARGIPAVPVFWMETEDHDLAEVTHCTVRDSRPAFETVDYRGILFQQADMPPRSVGSIHFPESIRQAVEHYAGRLPEAARKNEIRFLLESAYRPGATFTQAFAELLSRILRGTGLILYDAQERDAKGLVTNIFSKVLRDADTIHAALLERSLELETAGFHSQVSIQQDSTVLFLITDGERRALERRGTGFGVKNGSRVFSLEELLEIAAQVPERFSPNVLLRPLIQDHLFPTLAYVGGSSELAYFAQAEVLYRHFGKRMPAIWPRNAFTLVEPDVVSEMQRLGIEAQDCFGGKPFLTAKVIGKGYSKAVAGVEQLERHLEQVFEEIRPEISALEPPLAKALDTARRKISHNTGRLKSSIIRLEAERNSSVLNALDRLLDCCMPNRNLQERELGIHYFLALYGYGIIDQIRSATQIGNFSHRVLQLEGKS
jgi:bacillithiol biosynthesis cysteine-adding enzyme BshC